ncbi:hypothetical protein [Pseudomonas sp. NPDC087804]|uniref:hypothetical protein n=1 Tax=Pseudomonas sp. NPDC087804 TaxID=3364449 RepID=UPI0038181AEE
MKYSHALWGGRFNPIIVIDNEEEARALVERFRIDLIFPVGNDPKIKEFVEKHPHLVSPFLGDSIFLKDSQYNHHYSQVLDIVNAMVHWQSTPEWRHIKDRGIRQYHWKKEDPLSDVFLAQLGAYPSPEETGTDYWDMFHQGAEPTNVEIIPGDRISADLPHYDNLTIFGDLGLDRHISLHSNLDIPGFFIGSANDSADLVCHWNLRACDIDVWFIDPSHLDRYVDLIPELEKNFSAMVEHRKHRFERSLGVWSRTAGNAGSEIFKGDIFNFHISDEFWRESTVLPPLMHFGESSTLGVVDEKKSNPRVNFALSNKPFDSTFYHQRLVASIAFGGVNDSEQFTFSVPFIPELNEFYARNMHFAYNKLRIEPDRIGLIINTTEHDSFLSSLPTDKLFNQLFFMAGFESKLSNSGRIVRQLLTQLGGLQGARVFKIPGARELIKKFGPRNSFARRTAYDTITDKKQGLPATFSAHVDLYLTPRDHDSKLTPPDVFSHMVEKGLFRIGADLECEKCGMSSWTTLDNLKQHSACELCGYTFNATQQLMKNEWAFRRSGLLGAERNIQGAIPVALTLQQLDTTFTHGFSRSSYITSLDLIPLPESGQTKCEVDFVWLLNGRELKKSDLIIAECKDQGPISQEDFQRDVENMRRVADALPRHRFNVYILFVKLAPFTNEEIAMARSLNRQYESRVILLTARELEPYHIYEHLGEEHGIRSYAGWPKQMAEITQRVYFAEPR